MLPSSRIKDQPDAYNIHIRTMNIKDLYSLHKMYDSLSYRTKRFFHPGFLGFEKLSPIWFILQLALILSTKSICKKAMIHIFPRIVLISIVATNTKNEVVGFAFIEVKERLRNGGFLGELGIVLRDSYQGRGIGEKLMNQLIAHAKRENVKRIDLTVSTDNVRAIKLYKKFGFVERKIIRGGDHWHGQIRDCIIMAIYLES